MKRTRWFGHALSGALLLLVAACANVAEVPNEPVGATDVWHDFHLLEGPYEEINEALWFPGVTFRVGTGLIDPFLTIQAGGFEEGFNTDTKSNQFVYDQTREQFTDELPLNLVTQIRLGDVQITNGPNGDDPVLAVIGDGLYDEDDLFRELILDANEANSSPDAWFALNEFDLWVCIPDPTSVPQPAAYTVRSDFEANAECTLEYSFRVAPFVDETGNLTESGRAAATDAATKGSGSALDYYILIPESVFDDVEGCDYNPNADDCGAYVVLWSTMGVTDEEIDADPEMEDWVTGSTFEEFSTLVRPYFALEVSKTATGTYDVMPGLEVEKDVDPERQPAFAGDEVSFDWTITVSETATFIESNFKVAGEISVYNPSPATVTFEVSDVLDDDTVVTAIDCDPDTDGDQVQGVVGPEATTVCSYEVATANRDATSNTATVEVVSVDWGEEEVGTVAGGEATADIGEWIPTALDAEAILTDVGAPADIDGATVFDGYSDTYEETFTCSTDDGDYTDGHYEHRVDNTASILGEPSISDSDDATTYVDCYLWDVSKTADGSYDERHRWEITKTVDPTAQSGFAGDTLEWTWSVTWESFLVEEINHAVDGVITVTNPASLELTVDVADVLTGGFAATVECNDGDGGTSLTIAANGSGTCGYTAAPSEQLAQNTATATRNGVSVSDTVDVNWQKGEDFGLDATISDTLYGEIPADSEQPFTYDGDFTCATDAAEYGDDGMYYGSADNTATITWTGGSDDDSASTSYGCYLWDVSKTAEGTYQDRYDWDITKTVDPESQSGFAGDTLTWTWSITWSSFFVAEVNHAVSGVITVTNPADIELTVDVADELSGAFAATVTCNDGDGGTDLTIAAGGSGTCDYEAEPGSQLAQNTATAMRSGVSVSDTVDVNWAKDGDVGLDATISDTEYGDIPAGGDNPFSYPGSHTCSSDVAVYGANGVYDGSADNTATITWTGGSDEDSASTAYDCYIPSISKTAAGTYDETYTWDITKDYDGTYEGFAGDVFDHDYLVTVGQTITDSAFLVTGTVTVSNPNPDDALVVSLSDVYEGNTATFDPTDAASVQCDLVGGTLTVIAGGTATCAYEIDLGDAFTMPSPDADNLATATLNGIDFEATAEVAFEATTIGFTAINVDDTNGQSWSASGDDQWAYQRQFVCPTDRDLYTNGVYVMTPHVNTATIVETGQSDIATVNLACTQPWQGETAWAAEEVGVIDYSAPNWFTYVGYPFDDGVDDGVSTYFLYAGGDMLAGYVTIEPSGSGLVRITITLGTYDGKTWQFGPDLATNVHIQPYDFDPYDEAPIPGQFEYKEFADASPFELVVPEADWYGIHANVEWR